MEALSFLMTKFQRNGPQVLERDTSEWQEMHIHNCKPYLVNTLRKGGQGPILLSVASTNSKISWQRFEFSSAGILMGSWGHPRDIALCC